jgi:hypothetical protein
MKIGVIKDKYCFKCYYVIFIGIFKLSTQHFIVDIYERDR